MAAIGKATMGIVLGALLPLSVARAADQGITGKKLQLKDPSKVSVLSKDATINVMGSDPVHGDDSSITFDDGSNPMTVALPSVGWTANGAGTKFKYTGPDGSAVTGVKISDGKLKVKGKAVPFAVPNGSATIDVVLRLDGATNEYCMRFPGTGDGSAFKAKDAPAGTCPVCGNNIRDGGEECDGTDDSACPGTCGANCVCGGPSCGNNVREGAEACDGTDDGACPGLCQGDCTCGSSTCGNDVQEGSEECDGTDNTACGGLSCQPNCTCEDLCPADPSGCYAGSLTGFLVGPFTAGLSGGSGTIASGNASGSFTYSYGCSSFLSVCGGAGELFASGSISNDLGSATFSADLCIIGSSTRSIVGTYSSDYGGGDVTAGPGPCP